MSSNNKFKRHSAQRDAKVGEELNINRDEHRLHLDD